MISDCLDKGLYNVIIIKNNGEEKALSLCLKHRNFYDRQCKEYGWKFLEIY